MPTLGPLLVAQIDKGLVCQTLGPIWFKPVIGQRVRLALEKLFDFAAHKGYRSGDNPAALKGVQIGIPGEREHEVQHHAAIPFAEVPALIARLHEQQKIEVAKLKETDRLDVSPWLLEFLIHTGVRVGQCLKMRWREVNFKERMWHCPREHTKNGTPHNIPLTDRTTALLQEMWRLRPPADDSRVFPGIDGLTPLGRNTALRYLQRMGYRGPTLHGFRSSFKNWATIEGGYPRALSELALHHEVGDKVELAYLRKPGGNEPEDFAPQRRPMMVAWSDYLSKPVATAEVLEIPAA
jgi:integrase